jgi:predicted DNA-binding protein (MmcQ/YjbR family)
MPERSSNEQLPHVDRSVVDRVRAICLELPGTTEKEAWGDPSFRAGGRMYAIMKFGRGTALWLAAPDGAQATLCAARPQTFFRPSNHPLHEGWIGIRMQDPRAIDWEEIEFLIAQAYDEVGARPAARRRPKERA